MVANIRKIAGLVRNFSRTTKAAGPPALARAALITNGACSEPSKHARTTWRCRRRPARTRRCRRRRLSSPRARRWPRSCALPWQRWRTSCSPSRRRSGKSEAERDVAMAVAVVMGHRRYFDLADQEASLTTEVNGLAKRIELLLEKSGTDVSADGGDTSAPARWRPRALRSRCHLMAIPRGTHPARRSPRSPDGTRARTLTVLAGVLEHDGMRGGDRVDKSQSQESVRARLGGSCTARGWPANAAQMTLSVADSNEEQAQLKQQLQDIQARAPLPVEAPRIAALTCQHVVRARTGSTSTAGWTAAGTRATTSTISSCAALSRYAGRPCRAG
jgi:hypothetical protein